MLTEHYWAIICSWDSTSIRLISSTLYQWIRLIVVDNPFQLELPFCLLLISTKLHSGSSAGWSTSQCRAAWAFFATWRAFQAVLTSDSSWTMWTAAIELVHRAWSGWASLLACSAASPHRWASPCIGRNQAAAATSNQFGEIGHWGEWETPLNQIVV